MIVDGTGYSDPNYNKNRAEIEKRQAKTMQGFCEDIIDIRDGRLSKDNLESQALRKLSPRQRMSILAKLQEKSNHCESYGGEIEKGLVDEAIEALRNRDYRRNVIYRYVKAKDITEALKF